MKVKVRILTDSTHYTIKATGHAKEREDCARITTALEVFANQNEKDIVIFTRESGKTFLVGKKQDNYHKFVAYLHSLKEHYPKTININEVHYE